jgi:hypothetical protein
MTLQPTPIRSVWQKVKPYLEEIAKDYPWRPEDVYAECLYKEAVLYQNTDGFVVLKQVNDPYSEERQLFIWIGCSYENKGGSLIDELYPEIEQIARSIQAKSITFGSKRIGYDRVMGPEWVATRTYERLIDG